jgi:hypothetical protein
MLRSLADSAFHGDHKGAFKAFIFLNQQAFEGFGLFFGRKSSRADFLVADLLVRPLRLKDDVAAVGLVELGLHPVGLVQIRIES